MLECLRRTYVIRAFELLDSDHDNLEHFVRNAGVNSEYFVYENVGTFTIHGCQGNRNRMFHRLCENVTCEMRTVLSRIIFESC